MASELSQDMYIDFQSLDFAWVENAFEYWFYGDF